MIGHKSLECKFMNVKRCVKCSNNGHELLDCLSKPDIIFDTNEEVKKCFCFCDNAGHLVCPFPTNIYSIEDYNSEEVVLSEEEKMTEKVDCVKRIRSNDTMLKKFCPRCGENHLLEKCKARPPDNSFDKTREQFKIKEYRISLKEKDRNVVVSSQRFIDAYFKNK
jgi:predicted RNA-binding Zn-ribbon protein involved in translation (DUF1610 family)